jgi:hypothetical protein
VQLEPKQQQQQQGHVSYYHYGFKVSELYGAGPLPHADQRTTSSTQQQQRPRLTCGHIQAEDLQNLVQQQMSQRAQAVQQQQLLQQQQLYGEEAGDEPQEQEYAFLGRFHTAIVGIRYYTGRVGINGKSYKRHSKEGKGGVAG